MTWWSVVAVVYVTALSTQLQVTDRPVTQQGLGGPKTAGVRGSILFAADTLCHCFAAFSLMLYKGCCNCSLRRHLIAQVRTRSDG